MRRRDLTIDAGGRIVACSPQAAALLEQQPSILPGHSVRELIPELPFAPNTPGYNLAYAVFHAMDPIWIRRTALGAGGRTIPVDTALSSMLINGKRHITLGLRPAYGMPLN
jgi:PAS domain-containing protein